MYDACNELDLYKTKIANICVQILSTEKKNYTNSTHKIEIHEKY